LIAFPIAFAIGLVLSLMHGSAGGRLAKLLALISDAMANDSDRYWHMLGATIVVAATLHWPFAQTVLGSRPGRFLGKISFVLYLIQVPIICSLTSWLFLALAPISLSIAAKVAALSTVVVVFAVSAATCRFIDQIPTRLSRAAGRSLDALFRPSSTAPRF
jgi:peptidoglycan/LPS O-acetylase OafA/YrhL